MNPPQPEFTTVDDAHRIIVSTTANWSAHAEDALRDQHPPVTKIDLNDLEASQIDWSRYQPTKPAPLKAKKLLRTHQESAVKSVKAGLQTADRGKLIMACGTGKTFTALKIAEEMAGKNGRVLFLVPSLSLLSQTLTEWTQESAVPLHSFAVCSAGDVGKKPSADDDLVPVFTHELRYPATTDAGIRAERAQTGNTPRGHRTKPITNDSKSDSSSSVGAGPRARPRWDLEKGTHREVPLQTNSRIIDKIKSPGSDNSVHDFSQSEFTSLDDAARIVGCWKALSKQGLVDAPLGDTQGMQRAVAFCQVIDPKPNANSHKVSSKNIAETFEGVRWH